MKKNMAFYVDKILNWCKLIENRIVPGESPLRQFCFENFQGYNNFRNRKTKRTGCLDSNLVTTIEEKGVYVDQLRDSTTTAELAHLLGTHRRVAEVVQHFLNCLPRVEVQYTLKPIAQTVLKMDVFVRPRYHFDQLWHGRSEVFWLIVDNEEEILHMESFVVTDKQVRSGT
jgi:activating signal cointegrator complex subunit 3